MRTVVMTCILTAIAVMLFSGLLTPPLETPPIERRDVLQTLNLSDPGYAGADVFASQCAECHGKFAEGGDGPGLLDRSYAKDFRDVREFHEKAGKRIPEHDAFLGRDETELFNDLELMGTFLREMRAHAHKL